jgi:hypothetical protein
MGPQKKKLKWKELGRSQDEEQEFKNKVQKVMKMKN